MNRFYYVDNNDNDMSFSSHYSINSEEEKKKPIIMAKPVPPEPEPIPVVTMPFKIVNILDVNVDQYEAYELVWSSEAEPPNDTINCLAKKERR